MRRTRMQQLFQEFEPGKCPWTAQGGVALTEVLDFKIRGEFLSSCRTGSGSGSGTLLRTHQFQSRKPFFDHNQKRRN